MRHLRSKYHRPGCKVGDRPLLPGRVCPCGVTTGVPSKRPMRPACLWHAERGAKRCNCPDGGPFADLVGLAEGETDAQRRDLATLRTALLAQPGLNVALYEKYVAGVIAAKPLLRMLREDLTDLHSELKPLRACLSADQEYALRHADANGVVRAQRGCAHSNPREIHTADGPRKVCRDCGERLAGGRHCGHEWERVLQANGDGFWLCMLCHASSPIVAKRHTNSRFRRVAPGRALEIEDGSFSWDCKVYGHAWNEQWDDGLDCIACGVAIPADARGKSKNPRNLRATLTWVVGDTRGEYYFKPDVISYVTERPDGFFDVTLKDGSTYRRMRPKALDAPGGYFTNSGEARDGLRTKKRAYAPLDKSISNL